MGMRSYLQHLFGSRKQCRQVPRPKRKPRPLLLECLEDRTVLSTINWVNRGLSSDNFAAVFGGNAATARSVVDTAISEWSNVISNFHQTSHGDNNHIDVTIAMNTAAGSSGGNTSVTSTDTNGKPLSATISLGRTGDGTNGWYLNSTLFTSAYLGTPTNAFAGYAQSGSAASNQYDLMQVATHELGHAVGFGSTSQFGTNATDTGVLDADPDADGLGHLFRYNGSGGFTALLTSSNGSGHDAGPVHFSRPGTSVTVSGTTYYGADDLMDAHYGPSQRRIVSTEDAYILANAYGYTVIDPAAMLGTFYAVRDETGVLTVRGRQDASSADTVAINTITTAGVNYVITDVTLGSPVPGTGYTGTYHQTFNAAFVGNIHLQTGEGSSAVNIIRSYTAPITVVSNGPATVTLGAVLGNSTLVQAPVTITNTNGFWLSQVVVNDSADNVFESVTLDKTMIGGATYGTITGLTGSTVYYKSDDTGTVTVNTGIDPGIGLNAALVNVQATVNLTTITGHGHNRVVVGKNHLLDDVQVSLTINNPLSFTSLFVDDASDTVFRDITMENASLAGWGRITGLQPATIEYKYADVSSLSIDTGVGPSATEQAAAVAVRANSVPTILTGHGLTKVTIGNAGHLTDIGRDVTVTSTTNGTDVVSDDSADTTARTVTVDDLTVSYGNPSAILHYSHLSSLTLNNGTGGSSTFVSATGQNEPVTIVNQAAGHVYVGKNHKLQDVKGDLTVRNQTGSATIELDNAADPLAHDGMVHGTVVDPPQINFDTYTPDGETVHGSITGIAPAAINYRASGVADVIVRGGIGDGVNYNVFDVNSTPAGVQLDLYGIGHTTQFSVSADTDAGLNGPVDLHGSADPAMASFAVYYDTFSPGGQTYTLTTNSVSVNRDGVALVTYEHLGEVILASSSSGGNTTNVVSNLAGTTANIQAANGDTVTVGSLVDPAHPELGHTLATIQGSVGFSFFNIADAISVTVDDSGNTSTAARNVTFSQPYISLGNPEIDIQGLTTDPSGDFHYNLGASSSVTVLGGAGDTTYHMKDFLTNVPLTLTAGSGTNTLDYSAATGNVYVDLNPLALTATDLAGFSNIQNVIGASGGPAGSYNILIGGGAIGGDVLTGGNGRSNLLIAGSTAGKLIGGDRDDILIGGTTAYDTEAGLVSLKAIMDYWSSSADDYATRVANLTSGIGVPLLDPTTVTSNGGGNTMTGNNGGVGELNLFYGLDRTMETTDYNSAIGEQFINC
jgi:hypothetical protein